MLDAALHTFRAIGEETRLRILLLLLRGELTVTELTQILGQSQPRVSRHLKILADAGLVERHREGTWMFYRLRTGGGSDATESALDVASILNALSSDDSDRDRTIARDRQRFDQSRAARAATAAAYFEANAADWDTVRRLHLPERDVEERLSQLLPSDGVDFFVDAGTGTGRMLELFAPAYRRGLGFDQSREMLAVARANLERAGVTHAQVRLGDLFAPPIDDGAADVVCIHQVLHFLAEPGAAVEKAARLLKPGGRLILSDFGPHGLEFLRDAHAHRRLGFSDNEVRGWCVRAGLNLSEIATLAPTGAPERADRLEETGDGLTVKIWACDAPSSIKQRDRAVAKSHIAETSFS